MSDLKDLLPRIYAKCTEDAGCLRWNGATTATGLPQMRVGDKTQYVRRVVYECHHGKIPTGKGIAAVCETPGCVEIGCLRAMTRSQSLKLAASKGSFSRPDRIRKITATRNQTARISQETVDIIRAAETGVEAVRLTGVSRTHVSSIRRFETRVTSSPFAGLGARA